MIPVAALHERLTALVDLSLTLKHIHWNVVGPGLIGVHEMLGSRVDGTRVMADVVAERLATLGGVPNGLPGPTTQNRAWDDYSIGRATVAPLTIKASERRIPFTDRSRFPDGFRPVWVPFGSK